MGNNTKKHKPQRTVNEKKLAIKEAAKQERKAKKKKTALKVTALCLAGAAVIGGAVFAVQQILKNEGVALRNSIAVETEHISVDNAMFGYYLDQTYHRYKDAMAENENAFHADESKSFKKQKYSDDQTFFQYMTTSALYGLENVLKFSEAAYAAGYELPAEEVERCEKEAAEYKSDTLPKGIKTEDIAKMLKISATGAGYCKDAVSKITITDDELETYKNTHINNYRRWKMLCQSVLWSDETSDDETVLSRERAEEEAKKLADCTSPEAFTESVRTFISDVKKRNEEDTERMISALPMSMNGSSYPADIQKWVVDDKAKVNETYIVEDTEGKSFTVYMLTTEPEIDESETVDIRVIACAMGTDASEADAKAEAQRALDDWKSNGATEELFSEMATDMSDDMLTYSNGGLYMGYSFNTKTYGDDLHDWAFSADRKAGDTGVFMTTNAAVAAYFVGKNDKNAVYSAAYKELYDEKNSAITDNAMANTVIEHEDVYNQLDF